MDEPRYNIRAVERTTGVPAATLRSWERRYGFPAPGRTITARRLYSEADVRAIRWIKTQTERGLSVAQAVAQVRVAASPPPPVAVPHGSPEELVALFIEAVVHYDELAAEAVLTAAFSLFPSDTVILEVLTPVLVEIGERWARGELAVGIEHFASGLVRRRLFSLLAAQPELGVAPTVVLACVPEEHHEVGLLMLALFLRWTGLHIVNLGADVPTADLIRCVQHTGADAVCLSAIHAAAIAALPGVVRALRGAGVTVPVFAGGSGLTPGALSDVVIPAGDLRQAALHIAGVLQGARPPAAGPETLK